jgi:hypothetical protein
MSIHLNVYVYIHTYHTCTQCIAAFAQTRIDTVECIYVCTYTYTYIYIHTYIYIYIYIYIHSYLEPVIGLERITDVVVDGLPMRAYDQLLHLLGQPQQVVVLEASANLHFYRHKKNIRKNIYEEKYASMYVCVSFH